MLVKMDYSRVYELILAELWENNRYDMVEKLKENPPKKYSGRILSIDLAQALVKAKKESLSSRLDNFKLADMDAVKPYGNLRQILNNMDENWFSSLKSSGSSAKLETRLEDPEFIDLTNIDYEEGNKDDECECDMEGCGETATWKDPDKGIQVCDQHVIELGRDEYKFLPWDCPNDEYYEYREDLP